MEIFGEIIFQFFSTDWIVKLGTTLSTDEDEASKLTVFPNPTHSKLNVELTNGNIAKSTIITGASGKT